MVTYSRTHLLLRMNGSFGNAAADLTEQWSCGLRVAVPTGTLQEASKLAFLQTIQAAVKSFHTSGTIFAHDRAWLTNLTAAYIGTDGKYLNGGAQPTTVYVYPTPGAGASTNATSWDVCRTYTLRTALGRGRGHAGRFYWPCAESVSTDGRWTGTAATTAAGTAKVMLDAINSAAKATWPGAGGISVFSPLGAPEQVVRQVQVGRAPDTMRSRTKALVEDYRAADLAGLALVSEVHASQTYRAP